MSPCSILSSAELSVSLLSLFFQKAFHPGFKLTIYYSQAKPAFSWTPHMNEDWASEEFTWKSNNYHSLALIGSGKVNDYPFHLAHSEGIFDSPLPLQVSGYSKSPGPVFYLFIYFLNELLEQMKRRGTRNWGNVKVIRRSSATKITSRSISWWWQERPMANL